ncbi:Uma2 family endonuclease [Synechocystis salina LEGE 06099]|uniref:Uma2 family endonuclease n=1 Tax=Synechocystis salina TaxID=945780 RepID=UPI00187EB820|nr:Uma2 family endonuclease [Synechocystis salina]MBE9203248.1 Uma2 family endonuclease [Synechocystis salina LEGE 06099]
MYETASQFEAQMPNAKLLLSDEPEMESSLHSDQLMLLVACLNWLWRDRQDYFIGANLTIYFSRQQLKNRDFRGPDFFLVKGVKKTPRPSWVVWEEDGQYPNLIIELLSDSTASTDRSLKKQLYQDRFRTPEYFWFSPDTLEFEGFRLVGHRYESIPLTETGKRWSEELELFLGVENGQLRYFFLDEALVPTPQEAAETAQQLLQREKIRADRLAEYLMAQGIDPDRLADD